MRNWLKGVCVLGILALTGSWAEGYTFDDVNIEFWAGTGQNRSALVIDWAALTGTGEKTKIFGYYWDEGVADTVLDMIEAVKNYNGRFYRDWYALNAAIYGFGWDANEDGTFDKTDPGDWFEEGWGDVPPDYASWGHWISDDGQAWTWVPAGPSLGTIELSNGFWDGWSWPDDVVPVPPAVAIPEPVTCLLFGLGGLAAACRLHRRRRA